MNALLDIAIILIGARVFGEIFERIKLSSILGYLLAGLVFGPLTGLVDIEHINIFGEIGLILLLFIAGFKEVNTEKLLKEKKYAISVGMLGALFPLALGFLAGQYFGFSLLESLFLGVALSPTSISISVAIFIKLGKLDTRVGRSLIGAAIVDDIATLMLLAAVGAIASSSAGFNAMNLAYLFGGMLAFFLLFLIGSKIAPFIFMLAKKMKTEEIRFSIAFVIIILLAYLAQIFGLSTVIGAFMAGIILSKVQILSTKKFAEDISVVSEGIFIPFFFAWVGLQLILNFSALSLFTFFVIIAAFLGKMLGVAIPGIIGKLNKREIFSFGIGMLPRGEVALVALLIGKNTIPEFSDVIFSSVLITIIITMFLTPVILQKLLEGKKIPK